jgi:hypothetical protein
LTEEFKARVAIAAGVPYEVELGLEGVTITTCPCEVVVEGGKLKVFYRS